jgi:hypothetical protein
MTGVEAWMTDLLVISAYEPLEGQAMEYHASSPHPLKGYRFQ